jgi:hypothetical protein
VPQINAPNGFCVAVFECGKQTFHALAYGSFNLVERCDLGFPIDVRWSAKLFVPLARND